MNAKPHHKKKGQSMTEYLILTSLIGIGSMAVVQIIGKNLQAKLGNIANVLAGKASHKFNGEEAQQNDVKKRDLGDFSDAISDTGGGLQ